MAINFTHIALEDISIHRVESMQLGPVFCHQIKNERGEEFNCWGRTLTIRHDHQLLTIDLYSQAEGVLDGLSFTATAGMEG